MVSGEDEDELNGKVYGVLFIVGVSSFVVGALLFVRTDALLDLLSVMGEVKMIVVGYMCICGLVMFVVFLMVLVYVILVVRKDIVGSLFCVAFAAVVNFVGDYFMVVVFKIGVVGVVWVMMVLLYIGLIVIMVLFY